MKPISSRSDITLRIVAGERSRPEYFESVREPIGWPSAMYRSIKVLSRTCARLSSIDSLYTRAHVLRRSEAELCPRRADRQAEQPGNRHVPARADGAAERAPLRGADREGDRRGARRARRGIRGHR